MLIPQVNIFYSSEDFYVLNVNKLNWDIEFNPGAGNNDSIFNFPSVFKNDFV